MGDYRETGDGGDYGDGGTLGTWGTLGIKGRKDEGVKGRRDGGGRDEGAFGVFCFAGTEGGWCRNVHKYAKSVGLCWRVLIFRGLGVGLGYV